MQPKDYLAFQCASLRKSLQETLRNRYGIRTDDFFAECIRRIDTIEQMLAQLIGDATDPEYVDQIVDLLDGLSSIVISIERSHLEEFSWPFAFALRDISQDVCKASYGDSEAPLFFFGAGGGLAHYEVIPESRPLGFFERRIISVTFPRTLKNAVLLHCVLGHEIGHAAIVAQDRIAEIVEELKTGSCLSKESAFFSFCQSVLGIQAQPNDEHLRARANAWAQEIVCDLFALIMMGPSYLQAFASLLESESFGEHRNNIPIHPPFSSRMLILFECAKHLEMNYSTTEPTLNIRGGLTAMEKQFEDRVSVFADAGFNLLSSDLIILLTGHLMDFLGNNYPQVIFVKPTTSVLTSLTESLESGIPPTYPYPAAIPDTSLPRSISAEVVDFRHILLAGWMAVCTGHSSHGKYQRINELCSLSIMQQQGLSVISTGLTNS